MHNRNISSPATAIQKSYGGKLKAFGRKLLLLTISVIIGLLIGEGIIRLLFRKTLVLFPRYHTDAVYGDFKIRRVRSNMIFSHTSYDGTFHFKTNNKGFRSDTDINYKKDDGEIRVLSLGDSHTQGYEVNQNETFSDVTETVLKSKGINCTVINGGVSGFSTAEELLMLENEGYKYKPDYVVLGFYANDFEDNLRTHLFDLKNDSLVIRNREYIPGVNIQNKLYKYWLFRFLGEHSYLYGFAFSAVWDTYQKIKTNQAVKNVKEYAISTQNTSNYSAELMKKLIARMYNFCRRNGIKLIIVDIPGFNPNGSKASSIPISTLNHIQENCDQLYYYNNMLGDYKKIARVHLDHGHRHISKETHEIIGKKIADYVLSSIK
jgi:lysophospholipase L1-like esterase